LVKIVKNSQVVELDVIIRSLLMEMVIHCQMNERGPNAMAE
jgi:hypothetical protein